MKTAAELLALVAATKVPGALPLLILFGGSWCQPCKQFKPVVAKETATFDRLDVVYYDLDEGPVKGPFPVVRSIPVLMLVRRGKVVKTSEGALSSDLLTSWLRNALRSTGRRA